MPRLATPRRPALRKSLNREGASALFLHLGGQVAKLLLDNDPITGEKVWFGFNNHENKVEITHEQDVQSFLDYAHSKAVDDDFTKRGIKNEMWKYATLPNIVIMEMKQKHGVDIHNKNDWPKVLELINTEYSRFKTTGKVHRLRSR